MDADSPSSEQSNGERPRQSSPFDDDGAATTANDSPLIARPRGFGIRHLLAWTALTAVVLSTYRVIYAQFLDSSSGVGEWMQSPIMALGIAIYSIALGGQLLVTGCLAAWRLRGSRGRLEPGHWLAIYAVAQWLGSMTIIAVSRIADFASRDWSRVGWYVSLACSLVAAGGLLWLASRKAEHGWWRLAFAVAGVGAFQGIAVNLLVWFLYFAFGNAGFTMQAALVMQGAPTVAQGVCVGIAMTADWRRNRPRPWTHWLAAGCLLAGSLATCLFVGWYAFNPPFAATGSGS